jgi:hypothetical protein
VIFGVVALVGSVAVVALVVVLARAGAAKAAAGTGVGRLQGAGELAVAAFAVVAPGDVSAAVVAIVFAAFAVTHARRMRAGADGACDCFGADRSAASPLRAMVLTGTSATVAVVAAAVGAPSLRQLIAGDRSALPVVVAAAVTVGVVWRVVFAAAPASGQAAGAALVRSSALFLERRFSRRTVLLRVAVAGSALAVAPLRYLLYPGSALACIVPANCAGGLCTDGYTGFCCEINDGLNSCPTDTFPGGWWMCTDYTGRRLCDEQGVRYYVDCNALPGRVVDGGCHCGDCNCDQRRIGCNIFRYGQCNTQIAGVTAVVCRMVLCENPSLIPALNCSSALAVDDAVCAQEASCLEPPALELAGAGGV